mgnify:CR=1 FL=1
MINKITAYIKQHHMIQKGEHVCVGVSGGADSVCLFRVLEELRHTMGFTMSVAHIEHGIRGEESLSDMEFVKELAEGAGISVTTYAYLVKEIAAKRGISLEEAGREARYQAFAEEAARYGANTKIALAHHANDNAETMLFHLCRGSGMDGLRGIRPVRGNIIRPLLCVARSEIEEFLRLAGQEYRTDATNAELVYSRNRIRCRIMPEMEKINGNAVLHMNRLAEDAAEISDYFCKEADAVLKKYMASEGEGIRFGLEGLMGRPSVMQRRILMELAARACGSRKDITREHIVSLFKLAEGGTGKKISLPYGIDAEKSYGFLRLYPARKQDCAVETAEEIFLEKQSGRLCLQGGCIQYEIMGNSKNYEEIPRNLYTKWFDYDKIKNGLCLRTRRPGDYFELDCYGHRQKLKNYFMNEKVPQSKRAQIMLLADGSHIVWMIGYRISEYYKVTERTKRILKVQYMEEGI